MSGKENEYLEMFMAEAHENYEQLNRLLTDLEKNPKNSNAINSIFRITHTLKGNAMGLGLTGIAELNHVLEDLFGEIKKGSVFLDSELFDVLFRAADKLGELIEAIKTEKRVTYKGIRTKLNVFVKKAREVDETPEGKNEEPVESPKPKSTPASKKVSKTVSVKPEEVVPVVKDEVEVIAPIEEELTDEEGLVGEEDIQSQITFSDSVNVPVKKLDGLLNLVGELLIEKDSLVSKNLEKGYGTSELARLHRITSDLQYGVMGIRLVQVGFMFNKFHRILRDVARIENKDVELILEGTEIEIDRNILKILSDSLVHLVRNAVSHGIETKEDRLKFGKAEKGKITLKARNEKDTVFIEIVDDGYGINADVIAKKAIDKGLASVDLVKHLSEEEKIMFIFEPGFSNAEVVTEVSGRGVGMDVVKRSTESIGGKVSVRTELGKGSVVELALPSSMALKGALLFEVEEQEYAVPLAYTEAVLSLYKKDIHKLSNGLMSKYLDRTMFMLFFKDIFVDENSEEFDFHKTFDQTGDDEKLHVLVVSYETYLIGFVVDKLLQQKEIVEKTLASPLDNVPLFSGATILGNGQVCMVMDIPSIIKRVLKNRKKTLIS